MADSISVDINNDNNVGRDCDHRVAGSAPFHMWFRSSTGYGTQAINEAK